MCCAYWLIYLLTMPIGLYTLHRSCFINLTTHSVSHLLLRLTRVQSLRRRYIAGGRLPHASTTRIMLSSCRSVYPRIPGEHEIFLDTTGTETDPEHLEQFTAAQITHAYPRQMKLEAVFRVQDSCQGNQVGLCDNYWRPATTLLDADAAEMPLNTYFEHMLWMIWASIQRLSGVEKDFESRKLARAFFGVDLPEPEPTEQEPCPEAKLVAGTVGTSRWQFAAGGLCFITHRPCFANADVF